MRIRPKPENSLARLLFLKWSRSMPVFVHLTAERNIASIRRNGIAVRKKKFRPRGVYAMPVTRNFYVSHQWLRELKRARGGTISGVYFRIPDDELVEVGHYNSLPVRMSAAEAVAHMMAAEQRDPTSSRAGDEQSKAVQKRRQMPSSPEGYEVIISRKIERSEIIRVMALPQVVGWRYRPGSNGKPPCACICCERGVYGIRKLERAVEEAEAEDKPTKIVLFGREEVSFRRVARLRAQKGTG
jgi:hypothetical protein